MRSKPTILLVLIACLGPTMGCGHQNLIGDNRATDSQQLPFDRQPRATGLMPTGSLVPSATHIPAGTTIVISLERSLSSASARNRSTFDAVLDDPIIVDGQTAVPSGVGVSGQVLDVKPSFSRHEPGYVRIALASLSHDGKQVPIATSSLFAKGGSHAERGATGSIPEDSSQSFDIVLPPGRRLSFRLTQNVDLSQ
jgi:hypothetical protein